MPYTVTVRRADAFDAARLAEIYAYYVAHTAVTFDYDAPSALEFAEKVERVQRAYPFLVVCENGRVMGYAYAGPFVGREAYRYAAEVSIYLDPNARGRGLGRALYEALETALVLQGIRNLYACIGVPTVPDEFLTDHSARFHAHLGYRTVGHFHACGYKFGRWYDMIWMEKRLTAPDDSAVPTAEDITLQSQTLESYDAYCRRLVQDPMLFADPAAFRPYVYDAEAVAATFRHNRLRTDCRYFTVYLGSEPVGELVLKAIDRADRTCELGICLAHDGVKGRGFGTRAEQLALTLAFGALGMRTVYADTLPQNKRSQRVLEKVGFVPLGERDGFLLFGITRERFDALYGGKTE